MSHNLPLFGLEGTELLASPKRDKKSGVTKEEERRGEEGRTKRGREEEKERTREALRLIGFTDLYE